MALLTALSRPSSLRETARRCSKLARIVVMLGTTFLPAPSTFAAEQEMEIPVALQASLFLKVISFDRKADTTAMVIGIAYQGGLRSSSEARAEAVTAFRANTAGSNARIVSMDLDVEDLHAALHREKITVLYVAPLRAVDIRDISKATRDHGVTSVTGVVRYVSQGIAVGVRREGDKSRLMINLPQSKGEGADFSSELLKLAEVFR